MVNEDNSNEQVEDTEVAKSDDEFNELKQKNLSKKL